MFFTRSVLASATILSFFATTQAWVLHRNPEEHVEVKRIAVDENQELTIIKRMFEAFPEGGFNLTGGAAGLRVLDSVVDMGQ